MGMRLRRLTSGRFCHGTSKWSEKLWGRLWRPMCRMSRKLRVVSIPTSAPLCSMVMLVATVVPWTMRSMSPGPDPGHLAQLAQAPQHPSDWSCGVLATLWTCIPRSDSSTRSVLVPPTSTPTRAMGSPCSFPSGDRPRSTCIRAGVAQAASADSIACRSASRSACSGSSALCEPTARHRGLKRTFPAVPVTLPMRLFGQDRR